MHSKKLLPYAAAILLFALLAFIQFKPVFSNRVINQSDILQSRGMSKEIADFRQQQHKESLWTNSSFGGMPAYQISVLYPGNIVGFIDRTCHLFLPGPAGYMFMFFFGFYILLLCFGVDPWLAMVGALAFGFSSYFYIILEVGHNSKANAMCYLPPVLGGLILLLRKDYWKGFGLVSLFMALELNANHLQVTYYGLLLFFIMFAGFFIKAIMEKQVRPWLGAVCVFCASLFISVLPNLGNLLCTYEYGKYSTRGTTELTIDPNGKPDENAVRSGLDKQYALQYSYGVGESFSFLVPAFKGGGSGDRIEANKKALEKADPALRPIVGQFSSYYGPQEYNAGPSYVGSIVILLALLALFFVDGVIKWPLLIASAFSIMLAWGKYFMPLSAFFLDYVPGYNKFRAVSIINIVAELCIPLLAALALHKLVQAFGEKSSVAATKEQRKKLFISFAVVGGFCLFCVRFPGLVNDFIKAGEEEQLRSLFKSNGYPDQEISNLLPDLIRNLGLAREAVFTSDALRSFLFVAAGFALVFLFISKKINKHLLLLGLGIAITADMWPVVRRYLNDKNFVPRAQFETMPRSKADEDILQDKSLDYRVLNTEAPFQDAITSCYHKSVGGYHGAKLKKYDELIRFYLFGEVYDLNKNMPVVYSSDSLRKQLFDRQRVLNMLNTKYILFPTTQGPVAIHNTAANGNAWLIKQIDLVPDPDSEMIRLGKTDTKTTAVVQQKNKMPGIKANYSGEGAIRLISYLPDDLIYESYSRDAQFAVFSEIYYPKGWEVYLDGKPAAYCCVNYLLRGMELPAGEHKIEFRFKPRCYSLGNGLAYAGSALLLLSVAASLTFVFRKGKATVK